MPGDECQPPRVACLPQPSRQPQATQGQLVLAAEGIGESVFAPLVVCDPAEMNAVAGATPDHMIRIIRGSMQIELSPDMPADRIAAIVHALEASTC